KSPDKMFWSLLSLLLFVTARGNPIGDQEEDIQVQENFDAERMYGKWYDIAIATTCKWMKNYKEKFNMGTLVLGPGLSDNQISTISTRLRQDDCTHVSGEYQKTSIPGKYTYYNPKWDVSIKSYVLRTNYEEYAVILMKKKSSFGPTTTLKLYGRNPELREDLIEAFQQLALEMGIPEDSIFILANKGKPVLPSVCGNKLESFKEWKAARVEECQTTRNMVSWEQTLCTRHTPHAASPQSTLGDALSLLLVSARMGSGRSRMK
uniref:Protein AMBP n=1 Tax=Nothoprocta perdicaria TaxID=30464 RepID=A0A8C6YWE0_NOTPE